MRLLRCHGAGARIPAPRITQTSEEMRESIAQMRETGALLRKQKIPITPERGASCLLEAAVPSPWLAPSPARRGRELVEMLL